MDEAREFFLDVALPEGKAVEADDDLIIEGYASDFDPDREDEAFEPGCFAKGVSDFLAGQASLLYHHHNDQQLGQVLELDQRPDGLWMKAVIPKPADSSPLLDIYNKVKRGMMKGVSVRGFFKRRQTPAGPRIYQADIAEISMTPFPVNPRALVAVAAKAYLGVDEVQSAVTPEDAAVVCDYFNMEFARLTAAFDQLARGAANVAQAHVDRGASA